MVSELDAVRRRKNKIWLRLSLGIVLLLFLGHLTMLLFTGFPIFLVQSVAQETEIMFPTSARLVKGHCYHFTSIIVKAKLRMPRKDLTAFLQQPKMGQPMKLNEAFELADARRYFAAQGWNTFNIRHSECRFFSNGSPTWLLLDLDNPSEVTIYVYEDEP